MTGTGGKTWFAIDVTAHAEASEAVEYAFNQLACLGTEINYQKKEVPDSDVRITGYFDRPPGDEALKRSLAEALRVYGLSRSLIIATEMRVVPETDWLAEWKRHWQPTSVGRFVIAPPWADIPATEKIVIRIEPNMAFGTGTHETTQLCLQAIGSHLKDGMSFLDVGTGTGILAIAAAKLAPRSKIAACDLDADAVRIARENAMANGVGHRLEFFEGSIACQTLTHDFICANLTLDVISPLLPMLMAKADEILLLSGILAEQEESVGKEIERFEISNLEFSYSGEWLAALIRK